MAYAKTDYPTGATWRVEDNGKIYTIWLEERRPSFEVWRYSSCWKDKSGYKSDWTTSYKDARKNTPTDKKMKRIK